MKVKVFKCIYCDKKYVDKKALYEHINSKHSEMLPQGVSPAQQVFNVRNKKTHGNCIMCGKETKWNESTERYERLCSKKCSEEYRNMFKNRMINSYGKVHLLNDPEQQKKMLKNRKISGEYTWSDGTKKCYTGSYELDFLRVCDKILNLSSQDVLLPAPMVFNYKDQDNVDRFYIVDAYIVSLNTLVEIKDGGDNPNKHHKIQDVDKIKEKIKDDMMRKQTQYNYVKITDKNYSILINFLLDLKDNQASENGSKLPIVRIEEAVKLVERKLINQSPELLYESTTGIVGDLEKIDMLNESNPYLQDYFNNNYNNRQMYTINENSLTLTIRNFHNILANSIATDLPKGKIPDGTSLLKIANSCKTMDEVNYLRNDAQITLRNLQKLKVRKPQFSAEYEKYEKWIKEVYRKALNDKADEIRGVKSENTTCVNINSHVETGIDREIFGIKDTKQFPLNTAEEISRSIKNFMKAPKLNRKELADNICKRALELNVPINENSFIWNFTSYKKSEVLSESQTNEVIYHLSTTNNDGKTFNPRIPKNWRTENGYEDNKTPRICFSNSIDGCLKSLSTSIELPSKVFYVHIPAEPDKIKVEKALKSKVPDSLLTSERWVMNNVKLKCIGKIVVKDEVETVPYYIKNKAYAEIKELEWEWIRKDEEIDDDTVQESVDDILQVLQEGFTIDTEGSMILNLKEKTDFMSKYNLSHKLLKIYYATDNLEGIKYELSKLYYMYEIIEYYYVNPERNNVSKLQQRLLAKNKKEAIKAKSFILNDFSTGLKFILKREKDFNFQLYFMETDYYKDVIKLDSKKIKGIKNLIKSIIL